MYKKMKYSLLALLAVMGMASCSNDYEYTPAGAESGNKVFFPAELLSKSSYNLDLNATSFDIQIERTDTVGELTVALENRQNANSTTQLTVPESVTFANGENTATITIAYDPSTIEFDDVNRDTLIIAAPELLSEYSAGEYRFSVSIAAPWIDLGMALYREDLIATLFNVDNLVYEVPIQEDMTRPGVYRLLNPYGAYYPYNEPGDYNPNADYYMVIHAEDPDHVWVEDLPTETSWNPEYGNFFFTSLVAYNLGLGVDMETIMGARPQWFGTMSDGIITMPAESMGISMELYNDANLYVANRNGLFAIALPGHSLVSYDYSARASYVGVLKGTNEQSQAVVDLTLGEDVASAKYALTGSAYSEDVVASAIVDGEIEAAEISKSERVYLPLSEDGKYRVTVVTFDAEGNAQESASTVFEFESGGSSWVSLGMGLYTEDLMTTFFNVGNETYEVEIFEKTTKPGLYRLKNPYGEAYPYNEPGDWDSSRDYYLEIDATNPNAVWFDMQEMGLDWGYGMLSVWSLANASGQGYGTLKDGVITFPEGALLASLAGYENGAFYYANNSGAFKVVLPDAAAGMKARKAPAAKKRTNRRSLKEGQRFVSKKVTATKLTVAKFLK